MIILRYEEGIASVEASVWFKEKKKRGNFAVPTSMLTTYTAGKTRFLMIRSHSECLDKELHCLLDTVLIIKAETTDIQSICICRVHS